MPYKSDLSDTERASIEYCFPKPSQTGRLREHSYRDLINAIFYVARTGCQWRNLPGSAASSPPRGLRAPPFARRR